MKKKKIKLLCCLLCIPILACFFVGCREPGPKKYDIDKMYLVVRDNYGNSITIPNVHYTLIDFTYDYDETKQYTYDYEAYFEDGTFFAAGKVPMNFPVDGANSGQYTLSVRLEVTHPETGDKLGVNYYYFDIKINEKPDNRVTPEVYFDPNGATVEGEGEDIRYVYKYDNLEHWPKIKARYNGEEIEIDAYEGGIGTVLLNGEPYPYRHPRAIGEYLVNYAIDTDEYVNETDRERFYNVRVTITVEIR